MGPSLSRLKYFLTRKKPNGRALDYYTTISTRRACQSQEGRVGPVTTGDQSGAKVGAHAGLCDYHLLVELKFSGTGTGVTLI